MLKLVFVGDEYYEKSGTIMSSLYHEMGERSDWGKVKVALRSGDTVTIRPATEWEKSQVDEKLKKILEDN